MAERTPQEWLAKGGPLRDEELADEAWCAVARELLEQDAAIQIRVQCDYVRYEEGLRALEVSLKSMLSSASAFMERGLAAIQEELSESEFHALAARVVMEAWELSESEWRRGLPMLDHAQREELFQALAAGDAGPFDAFEPSAWLAALLKMPTSGAASVLKDCPLRAIDPFALLGVAARESLGGDEPSLGGRLLLAALVKRAQVGDDDAFPFTNFLRAIGLDADRVADHYRALSRGDVSVLSSDDDVPDDLKTALGAAGSLLDRLGFPVDEEMLAVLTQIQQAAPELTNRWAELTVQRLSSDSEGFSFARDGLEAIAARREIELDWESGAGLGDPALWNREDHVTLWRDSAEDVLGTMDDDVAEIAGTQSALGQVHAAVLAQLFDRDRPHAVARAAEFGLSDGDVDRVWEAFRTGDAGVFTEGFGSDDAAILDRILTLGAEGLEDRKVLESEEVYADALKFIEQQLVVDETREWLVTTAIDRLRQGTVADDAFGRWMDSAGVRSAALRGDVGPFTSLDEDELLPLAQAVAASNVNGTVRGAALAVSRSLFERRMEEILEVEDTTLREVDNSEKCHAALRECLSEVVDRAVKNSSASDADIRALRTADARYFHAQLAAERLDAELASTEKGDFGPREKKATHRVAGNIWGFVTIINLAGLLALGTLAWVVKVYTGNTAPYVVARPRGDEPPPPPPEPPAPMTPERLGLVQITLRGEPAWIESSPVHKGRYAELGPGAVADLMTDHEPAHVTYGEAARWCADYGDAVRGRYPHLFAEGGPLESTVARLAHRAEWSAAEDAAGFTAVGAEWLLTPATGFGWGDPIQIAPEGESAWTAPAVGFRVIFASDPGEGGR